MMNYIEQVGANVRLEEGLEAREQLLLACYFQPGISTKELARKTILPVPVAAAIKKELVRAGALRQDIGVSCTPEGIAYVEQGWGYEGLDKELYLKLLANGDSWRTELADVLLRLSEMFRTRPQANVQIDQAKCTAETSLKRAVLGLRRHALIGKRTLCVGDDDLVSVSLGLLLRRLYPNAAIRRTQIDVVDIDDRFLAGIRDIAEREKLPIACRRCDLREPMPVELRGKYDVFYTDPPYTLQGMSLFVSRGLTALKNKKGLPIFLSFAHKSPDFTVALQRELVRMGLMAGEVIPQFNEYEGAETIGNRSQMIVLKTTERTTPSITGTFEDPLYTGEVKRTLRTYRCKRCGVSISVGQQGDHVTIEELKNRGCRRCGNDTFDVTDKKNV
ncbi:hypothetical protein SD70_02240 [Gordoniibacillus kamchatkensis]|uniref:N(4)-bis(aminopropyl)spermidine synthase C-terminal domain-containing protein n=1 Tax=Gordoniibacillus kamchatkensis TaxID=1590651 RepID=A0ABR5APA4_9BACL|nr:bis-aminopropyl spermidine synthase family protein [Paenibacillus sp. VKM B-2647]KIL42370.1 hypothetical protein SD70_02240 [Paenibacillus sp. VKM B-2647]